ncbi:recombination regulator RecX [Paraburkholderia adhaesiva]|uniref:recombination regulator RecX n=1 Tax=Paraburkholderia adhaesiva TaxID=2883244 RepID=UPI001F1829E0|nr:recombination regulator RecX [Paraburkholderia adhaesiva]
MIRKGRSASAPTAPHNTGRPREGSRSDQVGRDVREGDRGLDHSGRDASDPRDDREHDSGVRDPGPPQGGPLEPFEQFDEFESSFGEFESSADAPGVATPNADAQRAGRFERTSTPGAIRSAGERTERGAHDHFERSSGIRTDRANRADRTNRGVPATSESADRFQRSSELRDEGARSTAAAESQRPARSLKGRALAYLSRREYSRAELSRKLIPFTDDADALEALLDALVRDGWLSDARFAESVIHRRAARLGTTRIVSELKRHAVGDTLIEEVNAQLRETELARARAVWRKKYGELPTSPAERARQARFLAARGFSMTIIGKILKGVDDDWAEN